MDRVYHRVFTLLYFYVILKVEKGGSIVDKKTYIKLSGIIFLVVAIVHALRFINGWNVVIGELNVPVMASVIGAAAAGFLAYTALKSK